MTAPLIQTEGLTRHFGDRVAVDSVDGHLDALTLGDHDPATIPSSARTSK